jgi:hypothetical protein
MPVNRASITLTATLAFTALILFTTFANGQSTTTQPDSSNKQVVAAQGPRVGTEENKVAEAPKPNDLESQMAGVKAENAAVRESLRKMEEQQKALLELVDRLQRRLDGIPIADVSRTAQEAETSLPSTATPEAAESSPSVSAARTQPIDDDHYRDGIVIWENPEDSKVPFLLRFNVNTQIRWLNTQNSKETFTDHLGNVREVHSRNDITVNRSMFILAGYMFSKKLQYSMTVWTSAGAASIVIAGNIGWRFNKGLTITGWHVPIFSTN